MHACARVFVLVCLCASVCAGLHVCACARARVRAYVRVCGTPTGTPRWTVQVRPKLRQTTIAIHALWKHCQQEATQVIT